MNGNKYCNPRTQQKTGPYIRSVCMIVKVFSVYYQVFELLLVSFGIFLPVNICSWCLFINLYENLLKIPPKWPTSAQACRDSSSIAFEGGPALASSPCWWSVCRLQQEIKLEFAVYPAPQVSTPSWWTTKPSMTYVVTTWTLKALVTSALTN